MSKRAALGVFKSASAVPQASATPGNRPDRAGRVALPFWASAAAKKQLRIMAAEMESTQQHLMTEALNDFFRKHGKPPIA